MEENVPRNTISYRAFIQTVYFSTLGEKSVVGKCLLCNTDDAVPEPADDSIIICIRLDLFSSEGEKCSFGSCVRVGVFRCSVLSKGSDKVDVEAIYCQSVLDNTGH